MSPVVAPLRGWAGLTATVIVYLMSLLWKGAAGDSAARLAPGLLGRGNFDILVATLSLFCACVCVSVAVVTVRAATYEHTWAWAL